MKKTIKVLKLIPLLLLVALLSVGYKIFAVKEGDSMDLASKIKGMMGASSAQADTPHTTDGGDGGDGAGDGDS